MNIEQIIEANDLPKSKAHYNLLLRMRGTLAPEKLTPDELREYEELTAEDDARPLGKNSSGKEIFTKDIAEAYELLELAEKASGKKLDSDFKIQLVALLTEQGPGKLKTFMAMKNLGHVLVP